MKMKHLYSLCHAGRFVLLALLTTVTLASCSDDDTIFGFLDTPGITNSNATVSSLTFEWDEVENVSQYVYELRDPDGELIAGDVTQKTRIVFTGLQPSTTYTLDVWAYAAVGSGYKGSKVASLTGTTADIVPLQMSTPAVSVNGTTAIITWDAVEYAASYTYSYINDGEEVSGTTTSTSLTLSKLPVNTYRVSITAVPDESDEAHSVSPAISVDFTIAEVVEVLYGDVVANITMGTYNWTAYITAYSNGTYSIANWYGYGANMEFTIDDNNNVSFPDYYYDGYWYYIPYDETAPDYYVYISDVAFTRNGNTCTLSFTDSGYGSSTITWVAPGISIDDLVGNYSEDSQGYDSYLYNSYWGTSDNSFHLTASDPYADAVVVSKIDDSTIGVTNLYWGTETLVGTVDLEARTITFATGQTWHDWYLFADENDSSAPVVATFDENGVITIDGWGAWYGGYTYCWGTHTVLTPQR